MLKAAATLALILVATPVAAELEGFAATRAVKMEGSRSWRDGGFGRLDLGEEDGTTRGLGQVDLAYHWLEPPAEDGPAGDGWRVFVHGTARAEPAAFDGRAAGVVEAYVEWTPAAGAERLRLRLGHFLLPTSRENVEVGWSSPYTLTFSALNTWIGEEVRASGSDAAYDLPLAGLDGLRATAVVFGGNDTAGTLLAWRGFAFSSRLTTLGERVPLPPLFSLAPNGAFEAQRDDGTRPFGADLDGRLGYFLALRWTRHERALFQLSAYDNRGDRRLHTGEYAWSTRFVLAGAELELAPRVTLLGEWLEGSTGMGERSGHHVDVDFRAAYALLSARAGAGWRASLRYDEFRVFDRDGVAESNDDRGDGWTVALLYERPGLPWRFGLEYLTTDGVHPAAAESGAAAAVTGRSVAFEVRRFLSP